MQIVFSRRLSPHWKEFKHVRHNPWVDLVDNAKMRPDVIIDPEKYVLPLFSRQDLMYNCSMGFPYLNSDPFTRNNTQINRSGDQSCRDHCQFHVLRGSVHVALSAFPAYP